MYGGLEALQFAPWLRSMLYQFSPTAMSARLPRMRESPKAHRIVNKISPLVQPNAAVGLSMNPIRHLRQNRVYFRIFGNSATNRRGHRGRLCDAECAARFSVCVSVLWERNCGHSPSVPVNDGKKSTCLKAGL